MALSLEQAIWQKLMVIFTGRQPPEDFLRRLRERPVGGVTLFRALNIDQPAQVRQLTQALQQAARQAGQPPLLIAADQEGGQLMAIGAGATPFPGNLALGAAGSAELAEQVGHALGNELAAMGVNVNYAPVCDVNVNPRNPVVGTRSFGEDPPQVAELAAAMITGLKSAGVAATAKHFPGHGDTSNDSHYGIPELPHDAERLRRVELPPFRAAIQAGVQLVMTGHVALPAFNGGSHTPATLSPAILQGLLRGELEFDGLIVTDALDMGAIQQGAGLVSDAIAATAAGIDLLLLNHPPAAQAAVFRGLLQAVQDGRLNEQHIRTSAGRVLALKQWLAQFEQPPLEVVGCRAHQDLALEVARRSVTRVRDETGQLPLRLVPAARLGVLFPQPADLTPADTSSYVTPSLARALRKFHPQVDELIYPLNPTDSEVAAWAELASQYDTVIAGTINAGQHPGQPALVNALLKKGIRLITVSLRMPYDLQAYPAAPTYLCTYSILEPSMQALAEVMFGKIKPAGRLPVTINGL